MFVAKKVSKTVLQEPVFPHQILGPSPTVISRFQDRPQPYDFGYNIQDEYGNNQFRQETGDANGAVSGTYGYTDALGIFRRSVHDVHWHALEFL